ncbi:MAG: cell division protein ZapA [Pseudomonadota bacterium]|jgi:hypothetical protein|nr:cell division protein ZapA [Pseudomonadota bacterium]MEC8000536.1 cell division protein ZapA [Pseudomonadota bacterium]|tara:strand:- start:337 stop:603 length:267 start_codon:yes stop_codon:yes gene_type:complete
MSDIEKVSLRVFGRDITLACPADEKQQLLAAAELLNSELSNIKDKENGLILAGLSLANNQLVNDESNDIPSTEEVLSLIEKIDRALQT